VVKICSDEPNSLWVKKRSCPWSKGKEQAGKKCSAQAEAGDCLGKDVPMVTLLRGVLKGDRPGVPLEKKKEKTTARR